MQQTNEAPVTGLILWVGRFSFLERLQRELFFAAKRLVDITIASIALLLLLPFFLILFILIPLDSPGSPIFRQKRISARRKLTALGEQWETYEFTCYKFRSMYQDCSAEIHQAFVKAFIAKDQDSMDKIQGESTNERKLVRDHRISRIGHVIRRTSIDEFPQLFNVLKGEMSIVGPRPAIAYEVELYEPWHRKRLQAKPGLTGWWQINGRGSAEFDEGVRQDIWYVEHQSPWFDTFIVLRTPGVILSGKGAK
jgi:lipopolysaccharide/colanic/teichoic acid biosynthesis glycosyltransferase